MSVQPYPAKLEKQQEQNNGAGCEFGSFLEPIDNCMARQQEVGTDLVYVT